jgi:SnoaL-like domain
MSEEKVEAFKRAIEAANRQDVEAFPANCGPEVEWPRPAILMSLGGGAKVYRGHQGVRDLLRDVFEVFAELHLEIVSELGYVVDFKNQKAVRHAQ